MAIVLVDYHKGNIRSVQRGLQAAGAQVLVSDSPEDVRRAEAVVLPGVGAYRDASDTLQELGLMGALRDACDRGVPFLGICLGMHLMFEGGEEHASASSPAPGLGLLPGVVGRVSPEDAEGRHFKVPHVGWNAVDLTGYARYCPLFAGVESGTHFYFTHSYVCVPAKEERVVATTEHGTRFASAVWNGGNLFGCQFHPEKSSDAGARIMENFVHIAQGGSL